MMSLKRLMKTLLSKLRIVRPRIMNPYRKIDKTGSMRLEIRHRKAQKLIAQTLRNADSKTHFF
ncbi:hypothetical protein Pint_23383 [Pistacia integerrima]|uniref:Uncharacterized protein n=1 Tax=Pistacia integerrima TaxID=434235 RepID=A0ACC0YJ75_9ROSI|nr:hypothetical protein Pint_23383 [Pistacia integerrima]